MENLSFTMPANACNSHLHIIDPSFPNDGSANKQIGTVEMYQNIATKYSIPRAVFVLAKPFGLDNSGLVSAIKSFGKDNARGIAVVSNEVSDHTLSVLHEAGVRGIRFSVWNPSNAVVSFSDCPMLAERIADMGWHVQLHMSASQILSQINVIRKLPCKVVIDHMGRLNPTLGTADPAFPAICDLLREGNTWIKLSGPYLNTATGYPWKDANSIAEAYVKENPDRLVWGSDFPHVTEKIKPDALSIVQTINSWLPDDTIREKVLVTNPLTLYGF